MKYSVPFFTVSLSLLLQVVCAASEYSPMFPYSIPSEVRNNITDLSSWHDAPAGKHGFIRAVDGHFVHDQGRFLIWGTNLCFNANFLEKEEAEALSGQLARLGFNCVRLHHMDARDIWGGDRAKSKLTLDPVQLDKLDYLVFQLKEKGIYVNINLHVSRTMDERDGFSGRNRRPHYDKGLDNFYPELIDVQKKYARDLLTHVNPYTKKSYAEEPAVAMIEINNENSVVTQWSWGALQNLPEPYSVEFQKQWNDFLKHKYGTTEKAKIAWGCVDRALGEEMLVDDFDEPKNTEAGKWMLQGDRQANPRKSPRDGSLKLEIENSASAPWLPILFTGAVPLEEGKPYTFSFRARSDRPQELILSSKMAHPPWAKHDFQAKVPVEKEWKTFKFTFAPSQSDEKARFDLNFFKPGVIEIAETSLKPGGSFDIPEDWSVEKGTVPIAAKNDSKLPVEARNDFCEFIMEIDGKYWREMHRFLKRELGVRQPVSGTQLHFGPLTTQAGLDYVDIHRYWNHPKFQGRDWDPNNWTIANRSLVDHCDTEILPQLATFRVRGKPYVVSEFDAPFPNPYSAEGLPILAAFARFQDWDGIFQFAYSHDKTQLDARRATAFFDLAGNTAKLAHLPACVALFCRGDIDRGEKEVRIAFTAKEELDYFKRTRDTWNFSFKDVGFDPRVSLLHRVSVDVEGNGAETVPKIAVEPGAPATFVTDTGQMIATLNPSTRSNGNLSIDTPNTKLYCGFGLNRKGIQSTQLNFNDVEIRFPGKTRLDWGTISIVSMNANGFGDLKPHSKSGADRPVRLLLTATGMIVNSDMEIDYRDDRTLSLTKRGGKVNWGTEPILCEAIPMEIRFEKARSLECYPLDENGDRRERIATDGNLVELKPEYKTIRYEILLSH